MNGQKVIVFEGEDGAGKTTIAKALSKELGIPYFKNGDEHDQYVSGSLRSVTRYAVPFMLGFLEQTGHSAIFDRFYPSEFAYSRAFGREYDPAVIHSADHRLAHLGGIIVMCFKHTLEGYNDDLIDVTKVASIRREYQHFSDMTVCPKIVLDTTDQNLEYQIASIVRFLDWKEGRVA